MLGHKSSAQYMMLTDKISFSDWNELIQCAELKSDSNTICFMSLQEVSKENLWVLTGNHVPVKTHNYPHVLFYKAC